MYATVEQPTILVVDDDLGSIKVVGRMLRNLATLLFAMNGADALRVANEARPTLILLDAEMPEASGFEVCRQLKANPELAHIPILFITSHCDEAHEVEGFALGAADFIAKPVRPAILVARVKTQLRLTQLAADLRRLSTIDELTRIYNRRHFDEVIAREWLRARRNSHPISLLMVDVDHFKLYNDHYGHPAGDACLRKVAKALTQAGMRPSDLAARYGGEEFALLLAQTPREGAMHVAERLRQQVTELTIEHARSPTSPYVTVSVGVASLDERSSDWLESPSILRAPGSAPASPWSGLVGAADKALYSAKRAGRARAHFLDISDLNLPERATGPSPIAVEGAQGLPASVRAPSP